MINLPESVTKEIFVHVYVNGSSKGEITISDWDMSKFNNGCLDKIVLFSFELDIPIPKEHEKEVVKKYLCHLQQKKKDTQNEYNAKLSLIDNEIQSLMAIEHQEEKC